MDTTSLQTTVVELRTDSLSSDLRTCTLLLCLVLVVIVLHTSGAYLRERLRTFFFPMRQGNVDGVRRTPHRAMALVIALVCASMAFSSGDEGAPAPMPLYFTLLGLCAGCFLLREVLYALVNWVFFDAAQRELWRSERLFVIVVEGLLFFAALLIDVCADLDAHVRFCVLIAAVAASKLALLYKAKVIFFGQMHGYLHIFPYLCSLEIAPLLVSLKLATVAGGFVTAL